MNRVARSLLWLWLAVSLDPTLSGLAASASNRPGRSEEGRAVFNGTGICSYCHGIDGYRDRVPRLADETAALIARLAPPPPDLRNPKALRLTNDRARARIIREGHPGSGMFPDATITDQELADLLDYLAVLRKRGHAKQP